MQVRPTVVAVIVVNQSIPLLCESLAAVIRSARDLGLPFDLAVYQADSADQRVSWVRDVLPWVRVIRGERRLNFEEAVAQGLRWAREKGAQFALLLTGDTVLLPGTLLRLYHYLREHPSVDTFGVTMLGSDLMPRRAFPVKRSVGPWWLPRGMHRRLDRPQENATCRFVRVPHEVDETGGVFPVLAVGMRRERLGADDLTFLPEAGAICYADRWGRPETPEGAVETRPGEELVAYMRALWTDVKVRLSLWRAHWLKYRVRTPVKKREFERPIQNLGQARLGVDPENARGGQDGAQAEALTGVGPDPDGQG